MAVDEVAHLRDLIGHMEVLPHHPRKLKVGNLNWPGCQQCREISAIMKEYRKPEDARIDPNEISRIHEEAFRPPEERDEEE